LWPITEIYQTFSEETSQRHQKPLGDMNVSWSKFEPGTPEYKQEASIIQSNF